MKTRSYPFPSNGWTSWSKADWEPILQQTQVKVSAKQKTNDRSRMIYLSGPTDENFSQVLDLVTRKILDKLAVSELGSFPKSSPSAAPAASSSAVQAASATPFASSPAAQAASSSAAPTAFPQLPPWREPQPHPPPAAFPLERDNPIQTTSKDPIQTTCKAKTLAKYVMENKDVREEMMTWMMLKMMSSSSSSAEAAPPTTPAPSTIPVKVADSVKDEDSDSDVEEVPPPPAKQPKLTERGIRQIVCYSASVEDLGINPKQRFDEAQMSAIFKRQKPEITIHQWVNCRIFHDDEWGVRGHTGEHVDSIEAIVGMNSKKSARKFETWLLEMKKRFRKNE